MLKATVLMWVLVLGLVLNTTSPALATHWQQVGVSADGTMRQYIDTESIQPFGHFVRVDSYVEVSQGSSSEIETYLTEYDCDRNQYRDIQPEESSSKSDWATIEDDPLNEAARQSACSLSASVNES